MMATCALDTEIKQALVYIEDEGYPWQMCLLLVPSGAKDGERVAADTDHNLPVLDTTEPRAKRGRCGAADLSLVHQ